MGWELNHQPEKSCLLFRVPEKKNGSRERGCFGSFCSSKFSHFDLEDPAASRRAMDWEGIRLPWLKGAEVSTSTSNREQLWLVYLPTSRNLGGGLKFRFRSFVCNLPRNHNVFPHHQTLFDEKLVGGFKYVLSSPLKFGEIRSNLTSIFFKWVESTNYKTTECKTEWNSNCFENHRAL